ncbi:MAG: hypothetical protein EA393_12395, partial [Bacteroidetes bacterium]
MQKTAKNSIVKPDNLVFILPLAALVIVTFFTAQSNTPVIIMSIILVTGLMAYFTFRFHLQVLLLKTTALTLPFSIEIPFLMESKLRFPGEIFILTAAMVLIFEILKKPYKELTNAFHREFLWITPFIMAFIISIPFSEMIFVSAKFSFVNILYISVFLIFLGRHLRKNPGLFSRLLLLYGVGIIVVWIWGFYRLWQWEFNPVVMRGIFQPFYKDHTIFGAS